MKGYHFVGDKLRDGRPIPADGEWLVHDGAAAWAAAGDTFAAMVDAEFAKIESEADA